MSQEDRRNFDYMLDGVLYAEERREEERQQRRALARLNGQQ